jgi:uncharacterized protein
MSHQNALPSPTPAKRRFTRRRLIRTGLTTIATGLAYGTLIESHWFALNAYDVLVPHLPQELDGLKVAHLTDFHAGCTPFNVLEEAINLANMQKPDLFLLTGDFVEWNPLHMPRMADLLNQLQAPLGLWGVMGNHDYYGDGAQVEQILREKTRIQLVHNTAYPLAPGLFIGGIEDTMRGNPDAQSVKALVPEDAACLFLTHNPTGVKYVQDRDWIAFAGHTHGGQVRLPLIPYHYPPGMEDFHQIEGWGDYGKARLYINRGVGCTAWQIRFYCRPEVAIFTLRT